ncbi:unnamed protein product [Rotaria socialis]
MQNSLRLLSVTYTHQYFEDRLNLVNYITVETALASQDVLGNSVWQLETFRGRIATDSDFNLTSYIESLKVYIGNSILARKQQQQLECDDECHVILQNKNLTQAVSVKLDELRQLPTVYTDFLLGYAPKNLEFVETVQRQLTQLVEETQAVRRLIQFYSFTPMQFHERYLIHQSAPFYDLQTQAMNPEPNRKTAACASCGICKIPSISLSETVVPEKL